MTDKLIVEYKKLLANKEQIESEICHFSHGYISKKPLEKNNIVICNTEQMGS